MGDKAISDRDQPSAAVEKSTLRRIKIYLIALAVLLSSLVLSAVYWDWADNLNKLVYDQLLQLRPKDPPADVIIVAIDEYSLSHIGEWPWSRGYHAKLIEHLTDAGVKAIGYDIVFAEPNPLDSQGDNALVAAIKRNGKVVLPVYIDRTQIGGQLIEVLPHPMFAEHANMGHVNTELDADGIVRRFYQYEGIGNAFWPHFATVVAQLTGDYRQPQLAEISQGTISPLINIRRLPRLIPFLGGVGSFQQVSFHDVISGKVPARLFKDRVVFVGATSISLGDLLPTPVTVQGEQMPGVEINATIFDAARDQGFIHVVDKPWRALIGVLFVLATVLLIPRIAGRSALILIIVASTLLFLVQAFLVLNFNSWLPLASAFLGQWLVYPLWTVLRLDQTLRYLQKQLILLHEELAQQSLADHRLANAQSISERVARLMIMANVKEYILFTDAHQVHNTSTIAFNEKVSALPLGPHRTSQWFSNRYIHQGVAYTLVIPVAPQAHWSELLEAYIVGFFESELGGKEADYIGTYDLVFKYLNEVRISQIEVNNARVLFEYCVNEMNDGVIIADEFGDILFINRLALSYLELPEVKQFGLLDLLMKLQMKAGENSWQAILLTLIADRSSDELEVITQSGKSLIANLSYLDVSAHRSNLIVINLYDITRIREVQQLRNETIDFLSHDMRSPMVSLLALVNQKRTIGNGEGLNADTDFLDQVEQYANKNLYFAEQFLQLARVESDEAIQLYDVDFEAIVRNAIDDLYSQTANKQMRIKFQADDELFWVKGNGELLERAVVNLIGNAIKYGPEATTIDVELKIHGEQLLFNVRDYGVGIPKEQQDKLFAPFQRVQTSNKAKQKGAGLGLRFVDVTVKRHGGEIYFTSQPGRTEFGFTLPLIPSDL